ncbi:MAG: N-acetyltransferase [Chloroflexi bacterium]|nr:N-acetyltransferase [Chloroflexota bacterium]
MRPFPVFKTELSEPASQSEPETTRTTEPIIRPAVVRDVPAMAEIINAFAATGQMLPRSQHSLYQNIRDFMVAVHEGKVVACGALHVVWGDIGEIRSLAVSSEWGRRGVGSRLVSALLEEARRLGLPRVFALTYQQAFFQKLGFQVVPRDSLPHKIWGDCLDCPKFPNCDEIAMIVELTPFGQGGRS